MKSITVEQCFSNFTNAFKISLPSTPALVLAYIVLFLLLFVFFMGLAFLLTAVLGPFPHVAAFLVRLIANLLQVVIAIGLMNVACKHIFYREKVRWNSAVSILGDWDFFLKALGLAILWILAYAALFFVIGLLALLLIGFGAALNSYTVSILIGIILGIPVLGLFLILGTGTMLSHYLLVPYGENESVFSAFSKGIMASFKNLSVTVSVFIVSLCIFLLSILIVLPMFYLISHHASPVSVFLYTIPVAVLIITIGYAYICFYSQTGHYIFSNENADNENTGYNGYSGYNNYERLN